MRRAQVTIEVLIILGAIILVFVSVSFPAVFKATRIQGDVQHFTDARYALETISTYANSLSNPYERRSFEVYIPGYTSVGTTTSGEPLILRATRIYLDSGGSRLIAQVSSVRRYENGSVRENITKSFEIELIGSGWNLSNSSGYTYIYETRGAYYAFNVSWKNISFSRK